MPLWSYEAIDEWLRYCTKRNHADGCYEHSHLYDTSIAFHHSMLIVLYLAEHWIAYSLDDTGKVGRKDTCVFSSAGILPEGGGTIELAYNHLIELVPDVFKQTTDKQFPSEAPHISER